MNDDPLSTWDWEAPRYQLAFVPYERIEELLQPKPTDLVVVLYEPKGGWPA